MWRPGRESAQREGDDEDEQTAVIEPASVFRSSFPDAEPEGFRTGVWKSGVARRPEELRPLHRTVLHALEDSARRRVAVGITLEPERLGEPETFRSYRELFRAVVASAVSLRDAGLQDGDRVLLVLPTSFEFVVSFLAVGFAGGVAVPAYPPAGLQAEVGVERLVHIAAHSGARLCVTDRRIHPRLGELSRAGLKPRDLLLAEELETPGERSLEARPRSEDPAFIQYTSGSTGDPKGVLLSHRNLVCNLHAIGQALHIRSSDRVVSWLPMYHDMGLIGTLLFSIYWRIPLALMSPTTFLSRPLRWLQAITRHRATLSPAPNFAYGLCVKKVAPEDRRGLDLSSWRLAMNGAEPVSLRTIIDFREAYRPHGFHDEAMIPVYGLAESSLAVSFPAPGAPLRWENVDRAALADGRAIPGSGRSSLALVSVGRPVPGHDVIVVDAQGRRVGDRQVGHIVVRGPSVMQGYFQDREATRAVLSDGWLWTGDLGYFADDHLFVSGRAKDLIILRGRNYYPEDLERCAERIPGVRAGRSVAFAVVDEAAGGEQAVLVCESRLATGEERKELARAVAERVASFVGLTLQTVVVLPPGVLPRTSSGKKQRARVRQLFLSGTLGARRGGGAGGITALARVGTGYVLAGVRRLFSRRLRAPE